MGKKCTKEKVNQIIKGRDLEIVGEIFNVKCGKRECARAIIKCLICDYKRESFINNILSVKTKNGKGFGCPNCSDHLPYDNDRLDKKLLQNNKNIKRLDDVFHSKTRARFQCLEKGCDYIWISTAKSIIGNDTNCAKCAGHLKLTNEIVDERMVGKNILRLGNMNKTINPINWECLVCNYIWSVEPRQVIYDDSPGCPKCYSPKNEKIIFDLLEEKEINFIHQYPVKNDNNTIYYADFYLPENNLIIEYNGAQHYRPVRFGSIDISEAIKKFAFQQKRDEFMRKYCKDNNISLIEIDGRKYINDKLKKSTLKLIKIFHL